MPAEDLPGGRSPGLSAGIGQTPTFRTLSVKQFIAV